MQRTRVKVTKGQPKVYQSSGTWPPAVSAPTAAPGLFYTNANVLPGIIDIQSATYDDPDAVPAMVHIQIARAHYAGWSARTNCPTFEALSAANTSALSAS